MQRVPVAFRAEGFNPDSPSVNTTFATKDIHSAYIRCLGEEDKGRTRVIIVVASNTRDENIPGGERVRLQTRMGQSGGVVGSGSSSEKWRFAIVIPQGQVYAGNYTLDLDLTDQNGNLSGTGRWADGPVSKLTGTIRNGEVVLYRVDNSTGFRGTFWGKVTANGRMEGTGQNDPLSPGGNNNSYTWTGVRMP